MQRDTTVGIKGGDKAQFAETKLGTTFTYAQAKVTVVPSEDGVGEEIYVVATNQKDTFWIENIEAHHFFGIKQDLLFVDNGTGPNGRSLIIYDLKTRKLIHEDHYEADISMKDGKVTYLKPIDTSHMRMSDSVCPDKEKWEKQGLGAGYAEIMTFDLGKKQAIAMGEYSCYPIQ